MRWPPGSHTRRRRLAMVVRYRRHRLLGGLLVALLGCALIVSLLSPAHAGAHPTPAQPTYLALGDSLAFGYSQAKFNNLYPNENPAAYDTGYVDDVGKV